MTNITQIQNQWKN